MLDWKTALICMALTVVAVIAASIIKIIVTKIIENKREKKAVANGTEATAVDKSKMEYPIAAVSVMLAFASVALFLKYYVKIESEEYLLRYSAMYACTVNTIYLFIVQLARKGFTGLFKAIKNIFTRIKASKHPVADAPSIIIDELGNSTKVEAKASAETSEEDAKITAIVKSFSDTLKK